MKVSYLKDYAGKYESAIRLINERIRGGEDKTKNWNKEFLYSNYKVNYVLETHYRDGLVNENIYFHSFRIIGETLSIKK